MERAIDETGSPVRAEAGAPGQALCPHCGGRMILRCRRRSSRPGDVTYFWRHRDNAILDYQAHVPVTNGMGPNAGLRTK
jgi:hypothetical protein